jgi:hypothetical protein
MGFFDKFIPKEIKKPFKKAASFVRKITPRELRPALPFLSAAVPFMLPGGFALGSLNPALSRGIMSSLANIGTQQVMDPEGDINLLSAALAGATGYGSTPGAGEGIRGLQFGDSPVTKEGILSQMKNAPLGADSIADASNLGFFERAANVGLEGLAQGADFLGNAQETMAGFGDDPGSLFTKAGAIEAGKAAAVPLSQGSGDLAYAVGSKAMRDFEEAAAAEEAEYGANEEARRLERYNAIRAGMEENDFTDEEIQVVFDRLGLGEYVPSESAAQGGIIGLKEGGMLNFGGREMDLRGGGFVPIGKKERADDVPARLSKNEFVMTADAVRAAGGGSVNKGAQRMYDVMNKLEARA